MQISEGKHVNSCPVKKVQSTAADRGVPYGETVDAFINS